MKISRKSGNNSFFIHLEILFLMDGQNLFLAKIQHYGIYLVDKNRYKDKKYVLKDGLSSPTDSFLLLYHKNISDFKLFF